MIMEKAGMILKSVRLKCSADVCIPYWDGRADVPILMKAHLRFLSGLMVPRARSLALPRSG